MDFVETSFYKQTNKKVYLKIGSYQLPHGGFFSSGGFLGRGTQTEKYGEFFGGTGRRKSEKTIPSD